MARGKQGAATARRRDHETRERVTELEEALRQARAEHNREVQDLKTQVASTEARLTNEVKALSEARVRQVKRECAEKITAEKDKQPDRLRRFGAVLSKHDIRVSTQAWVEIFDVFQCQPWDVLSRGEEDGTRVQRRANRSKLIRQAEMERAKQRGTFRQVGNGVVTNG